MIYFLTQIITQKRNKFQFAKTKYHENSFRENAKLNALKDCTAEYKLKQLFQKYLHFIFHFIFTLSSSILAY